jgi:hypothetical protein
LSKTPPDSKDHAKCVEYGGLIAKIYGVDPQGGSGVAPGDISVSPETARALSSSSLRKQHAGSGHHHRPQLSRRLLSLEPHHRGLFLTIASRFRVHFFPPLTLQDLAIPVPGPVPSTMPMRVIPACTVERNRVRRDDTSAVAAIAKKLFNRMRSRMKRTSKAMLGKAPP